MEPMTVYEVEGDFPNVGPGRTIGIFETEGEATAAAGGCGGLDCGGDGIVNERLAVPAGDGRFYLLAGEQTYEIGVAGPSEAKSLHSGDDEAEAKGDLVLTSVRCRTTTMRMLRDRLQMRLIEAKRMVDSVPCVVRRAVAPREVAALCDAMRAAGDTFEMRPATQAGEGPGPDHKPPGHR